ncbi:GerAB/ArcD/ProY family transporter [Metabacillus fastidiosus]|uniref:GerAB/ArcD/ProY family transporter n=1 Tax=Metabacillus fastidiosus TaxID=1458 RepID=A0ABU6NZS2_9BACI|nr:GerAB/ArcD/ProY family transporter [Metabacillus fastidiosus]MED4402223.1 GerAB/ArcD/ProY family transporter [Metabacillus fastidiosus]
MRNLLKENLLISPFLVFYIINSMQLGGGALFDLRGMSQHAGYDTWISIIVSGLSMHILIWLLYQILNKGKGDIVAIHRDLFGKWVGGFLSLLFISYFLILGIFTLRIYIEVIQVWIFPHLSPFFFSLIFLLVISYFVIKGFRVVTGICFLSILYMLPILLSMLFPLEFAHYSNLFPIMDHSYKDILLSSKEATLSMVGFESLLLFYPFIKNPERSAKWAHLAIIFTTIIYVYVAIITFTFYNQEQLQHTLWSTVVLWQIIELPVLERFEHLGLSAWLLIVLPNLCVILWGVHHGISQLVTINKKILLIAIIFIIAIVSGFINKRTSIEQLSNLVSEISFYIVYGYIPFLFLAQKIIYRLKRDN